MSDEELQSMRADINAIRQAMVGGLDGKGGLAHNLSIVMETLYDEKKGLVVSHEKAKRFAWIMVGIFLAITTPSVGAIVLFILKNWNQVSQ